MKNIDINKVVTQIETISIKASLLIKARSLNLSNAQMNAYRKIVKNQITGVNEWRSIESLLKKGLIKKNYNRKNLDSIYLPVY
jgi:hypothetical protein